MSEGISHGGISLEENPWNHICGGVLWKEHLWRSVCGGMFIEKCLGERLMESVHGRIHHGRVSRRTKLLSSMEIKQPQLYLENDLFQRERVKCSSTFSTKKKVKISQGERVRRTRDVQDGSDPNPNLFTPL